MQYVAVPFLIALSAGVALADTSSQRVEHSPRVDGTEQPAPPPVPAQPPPPISPPSTTPKPPAAATPLGVPTSSSPAKEAIPAEDTEEDNRPGWTGIIAGFGIGRVTLPTMLEPQRDYVAVGMELHWEKPTGLTRYAIILRPDLLMISGADEMNGSRPRLDLSALGGLSIGQGPYARVAVGPLVTYNAIIKGVDRVRGGFVAEASLGWRRAVAVYGEARKTWGSGISDFGMTVGLRFDLALLARLN